MNQQLSHLRLFLLVMLLAVEMALAISLRTSGWIATGQAIRSLMIAVAVVLPFVMAAVLLYRVRISLRHGHFSLRALMALTLVVGSFLALLPLFESSPKPNLGPFPLAKSVVFEVFEVVATGGPDGLSFVDPISGESLSVRKTPIIATADVSTVQLILGQSEKYPRPCLTIVLTPRGGKKIQQATTRLQGGRLAVVANGELLASPRILVPISTPFQVTGGRIHTAGENIFELLTTKARGTATAVALDRP